MHKVIVGTLTREYRSAEAFTGIVFAAGENHRAKLDDLVGIYSVKNAEEDRSILTSDEAGSVLRPMSADRRYLDPRTTANILEYSGRVTGIEVKTGITPEELSKMAGQKAVDQLLLELDAIKVRYSS
jgi:hypothetical protein